MKLALSSRLLWAGAFMLFSGMASAGITLGGTRVVIQAPAKEASILVKNQAAEDIMIQSWMEPESGSGIQDVPFAITPPLSRLGANKQQNLRILFQGQGLPSDRESVFRLSVQEIPQKAKGENTLQIALRQRIKVFYRPAGLPAVEDAPKNLKWRLVRQDGKALLEVTNDSPFHISFVAVKLKSGSKSYEAMADMIAPKSSQKLVLKDAVPSAATGLSVEFENVNDFGASEKHSGVLTN
ncbi:MULTISPECIES: fimbrial biogenesis chaperone [Pseudomonas aeruginosa group]|uniref:fimbrial biogenesis chaperone n=1 Tax=Pseudomonas aeruginosa group TaxID=136841 RepID=UPI00071B77AD|nr:MULTISPECIES: molecular chaperone [Pseudomonas aeruginosa group]KSD68785.1 molecular chaperone [Pseudomonas aeruginosa]MCT9628958.1 molecular chaperone [Pseudomonas aeruginosa]MCW8028438.1 molecular chaperone [Pseudomonas aeruginosa]MCW8036272.1 molecular chaperone [Pseudomonas aeruginosa]MDY1574501.1 molecular chaperone [Pseudomonas paraeruginosa]